ncbi:MAG: division/cell wall cluster transcriptional repressor MraZ [Acidobacteriaceae bacterium]
MFRGHHPARVDEKGRLKLPAEFKRQIDEQYGVHFYITSRDGKEAEVHPLPEWEKFEEKLAAVPSFNAAKKKLLKWLNFFGQQAEMDGQGRVLLPQILRERAKLTSDVIVYGSETHLKVANREDYDREMQEAPMTENDEQVLAGFGV